MDSGRRNFLANTPVLKWIPHVVFDMLLISWCWLSRLQKEQELFISLGGYFFWMNKLIFIKLFDFEKAFIRSVANVDITVKNEAISWIFIYSLIGFNLCSRKFCIKEIFVYF